MNLSDKIQMNDEDRIRESFGLLIFPFIDYKNMNGLRITKRLDIAWAVIGAARFLVL